MYSVRLPLLTRIRFLALASAGGDPSGWFVPEWSPEFDDEVHKRFGISTAIVSLTAPDACILKDREASASLARKVNELAAKLRDKNPTKYGFFASLPNILDTEIALEELAYAYDVLKADGIILFTRYGEGRQYLGDAAFKPIWAELNRRHAVILVHPTHPVDVERVSDIPQPILQYPMETTTAAVDMLHNKTVRSNPNCKIILSHAGGALPFLLSRPASMLTTTAEELDAFWDDARNFYYDVALAGGENMLRVMETFAKPGHLLYGSDAPYANDAIIAYHTDGLDQYKFADPKLAEQINRTNALELVPKLKG